MQEFSNKLIRRLAPPKGGGVNGSGHFSRHLGKFLASATPERMTIEHVVRNCSSAFFIKDFFQGAGTRPRSAVDLFTLLAGLRISRAGFSRHRPAAISLALVYTSYELVEK